MATEGKLQYSSPFVKAIMKSRETSSSNRDISRSPVTMPALPVQSPRPMSPKPQRQGPTEISTMEIIGGEDEDRGMVIKSHADSLPKSSARRISSANSLSKSNIQLNINAKNNNVRPLSAAAKPLKLSVSARSTNAMDSLKSPTGMHLEGKGTEYKEQKERKVDAKKSVGGNAPKRSVPPEKSKSNPTLLSKSPTKSSIEEQSMEKEISQPHKPVLERAASSFEEKRSFKRQYIPSPHQLVICDKLLPCVGDEGYANPPSFKEYLLSHVYGLSSRLNISLLRECLNSIVFDHQVLTTKVFRNTKIIDADTEFMLDYTPPESIGDTYLKIASFNFQENGAKGCIQTMVEKLTSECTVQEPFKVYVVEGGYSEFTQYLVFISALFVADETSLSCIANAVFQKYYRELGNRQQQSENSTIIDESENFEDFAANIKFMKSDLQFWRDQCIEVQQDTIAEKQKKEFEAQLKSLEKEKASLKMSLSSAKKQTEEVEEKLKALRKKRMELESNFGSEGPTVQFIDPLTGEVTVMNEVAKKALLEAVLGPDAIESNIVPFLEKHEVPKEVQRKMNAVQMTVEGFASVTEGSIAHLSLATRDRRQLLALAEYVRNRIKEGIQEQGKLKYGLEREIAKTTRNLSNSKENLGSTQKIYESKEDMSYRLTSILNPPHEECRIEPATIPNVGSETRPSVISSGSKFDISFFSVESEILTNLNHFRLAWGHNIRNKKKQERKKSLAPAMSSDNESLLEDSEDDDQDGKSKSEKLIKDQTVDTVCLAAFGVLVKHITGKDKFLVGVTSSMRSPGTVIGPLTDTFPVKIDISRKSISFSSLFTSVYNILKQVKRHGLSCPSQKISSELRSATKFPIQFNFINKLEFREWKKLGLTKEHFLSSPTNIKTSYQSNLVERVLAHNNQDEYDIKLVIVELEDKLECALHYDKTRFEEEKILKWVAKFNSTLEIIDNSRKRLSISSMISR
jgi:hypothetical protein